MKKHLNLPIHNPQNRNEFIELIKRTFDKFNDPNDPWNDALYNAFLGDPDNDNRGGTNVVTIVSPSCHHFQKMILGLMQWWRAYHNNGGDQLKKHQLQVKT